MAKMLVQVRSRRCATIGFTFVELMVALSMTSVVVAMAFAALQYTLHRDKAVEHIEERQAELNRAVDFMTDDVREAKRVSAPPSGNNAVMRIEWLDGSWVDYFLVNRTSQRWRGPAIVYRQDCDPARLPSEKECKQRQALVDAIAAEDVTCPGEGTLLQRPGNSKGGFRVRVQDQARVKICLWGHLPNTSERVSVTTQVFTRGDISEP